MAKVYCFSSFRHTLTLHIGQIHGAVPVRWMRMSHAAFVLFLSVSFSALLRTALAVRTGIS